MDAPDVVGSGVKSAAITKTGPAIVGPLKISDFGVEVGPYFPIGRGRLVMTVVVPERLKTCVCHPRQARRLGPGEIVLPVDVASQTDFGVGAECTIERSLRFEMSERLTVDGNHA